MKSLGLKNNGFGNMEEMLKLLESIHNLKDKLTDETHKCSNSHKTLELFRQKHPDFLRGEWSGWYWRDKTTKKPLKSPQHFCIYCMEDLPGS